MKINLTLFLFTIIYIIGTFYHALETNHNGLSFENSIEDNKGIIQDFKVLIKRDRRNCF